MVLHTRSMAFECAWHIPCSPYNIASNVGWPGSKLPLMSAPTAPSRQEKCLKYGLPAPPKVPQMGGAAPEIAPAIFQAISRGGPEKFRRFFLDGLKFGRRFFWESLKFGRQFFGESLKFGLQFFGIASNFGRNFWALPHTLAAINGGCPSILARQRASIFMTTCLNHREPCGLPASEYYIITVREGKHW